MTGGERDHRIFAEASKVLDLEPERRAQFAVEIANIYWAAEGHRLTLIQHERHEEWIPAATALDELLAEIRETMPPLPELIIAGDAAARTASEPGNEPEPELVELWNASAGHPLSEELFAVPRLLLLAVNGSDSFHAAVWQSKKLLPNAPGFCKVSAIGILGNPRSP